MKDNRPNILIWAVGHSGTSIITRAIANLGWNTGEINGKFENLEFLDATRDVHYKGESDDFFERGRSLVKKLPNPWVLKSTFVFDAGERWLRELGNDYLLLHFERDAESILSSHKRRNEGSTLDVIYKKQELIRDSFSKYEGQKISLSFENLMDTIDLFDTDRTRYGPRIQIIKKVAEKLKLI